MNRFETVLKEAQKGAAAKVEQRQSFEDIRREELKEMADLADILMDRRRTKERKKAGFVG